jgi:phosphomannomutase
LDAEQPETIAGHPVTEIVTVDGYKYQMGELGWMLIRFSGTEPIIRVYCELTDPSMIDSVLDAGLDLAGLK